MDSGDFLWIPELVPGDFLWIPELVPGDFLYGGKLSEIPWNIDK